MSEHIDKLPDVHAPVRRNRALAELSIQEVPVPLNSMHVAMQILCNANVPNEPRAMLKNADFVIRQALSELHDALSEVAKALDKLNREVTDGRDE